MFTAKNYIRAASPDEAWELNKKKRNRVVGGMMWLKMEDIVVDTVIDLCDLGLNFIEEYDDRFEIGAMTPLSAIERHEGLNAFTNGAAREAVRHIVGVQFRNTATVGGSIFGRFGFSDVLTFFLSTQCGVVLHKGGEVPLEEFLHMPLDGDILLKLTVKKEAARFLYRSVRNSDTDFPVLAAAYSVRNGTIRAAVGARPTKAVLISAEEFSGLQPTAPNAEKYGEYIKNAAVYGSNMRGGGAYRAHLAAVLSKRAFLALGGTV